MPPPPPPVVFPSVNPLEANSSGGTGAITQLHRAEVQQHVADAQRNGQWTSLESIYTKSVGHHLHYIYVIQNEHIQLCQLDHWCRKCQFSQIALGCLFFLRIVPPQLYLRILVCQVLQDIPWTLGRYIRLHPHWYHWHQCQPIQGTKRLIAITMRWENTLRKKLMQVLLMLNLLS